MDELFNTEIAKYSNKIIIVNFDFKQTFKYFLWTVQMQRFVRHVCECMCVRACVCVCV